LQSYTGDIKIPLRIKKYLLMQSKTLLKRTGCPEPIFKDWLRKGVILPARPGKGPGSHAEYDEANAVALLIGVKMKQAGVVVGSYAPAFVMLQSWLRSSSSLEWPQYVVTMTQQNVAMFQRERAWNLADIAFVVPLAPVCEVLAQTVEDPEFYQYSLLGLQSVRNIK
jgi:hypothetical protein